MENIHWQEEGQRIAAELTALRHRLHADPELGDREYHTAEAVEEFLQGCGIETKRLTETAVVGVLRGAPDGPTVALRADMDALPVTEATGAEFASKNQGVMHACGHDVHTAALLGAAKLLSLHREELQGTVKFFFQPNEEGGGGAKRMVDAGCMEAPAVEAVFGAHVAPDLPCGTVGLRDGAFYAASHSFCLIVKGKGAHGAKPEKAINALKAAAELVGLLQALPERFPNEKTLVTVGSFHAGTAENIIADRAELHGIIRTFGKKAGEQMRAAFMDAVYTVEKQTGVKIEVTLDESHPGIVNTDAMTAFVRNTLRQAQIPTREIKTPTMVSEDFGFFIDAARGSFYHFGVGGSAELHNGEFLPDDAVLPLAAAVHAQVAWAYLHQTQN